jgi:hypothetical protein
VQHIKHYQRAGQESSCYLDLPKDFPKNFQEAFNSEYVRIDIQKRIAAWKVIMDAPVLADLHDQAAIRGEDVALEDEPVVSFEPPRRTVIENSDGGDSVMGELSDGSSSGETEIVNIESEADSNWVSLEDNETADHDMEDGQNGGIRLIGADDVYYDADDASDAVTRLA